MTKLYGLLLVSLTLGGCSTRPGFVSGEWGSNMRELGIYPLFPPRASLNVGDVFIVRGDATKENSNSGFTDLGVHFEDLSLQDEVEQFYQNRAEFSAGTLNEPSSLKYSSSTPKEAIKLSRVAFPGFLKATASGGDISALVPAQGVPVGILGNIRKAESAALTVSAAETYSLPLNRILQKVGGETEFYKRVLSNLEVSSYTAPRYVDVIVISELYFARSFEVTIYSKESASASGNVSSPIKTDAVTAGCAGQMNTDSSTGATPSAKSTPADLSSAEQRILNDNLNCASTRIPTTSGGTLSVGYNATGNISLVQNYPTPIAIGYRGLRRRLQAINENIVAIDDPKILTSTPLSGSLNPPK